jgi:DDE superfamily endonuclease
MYHTTGFSKADIVELCALIVAIVPASEKGPWPPSLGLFKSVTVALTYARRNHVQAELGEYWGSSQSTISRAVTTVTPLIATALAAFAPTAEELSANEQYIVDGTLVTCWSWAGHTELYSGKHRTTGLNLQVVCDLSGTLRWISDPVDGARHDSAALAMSGVLDTLDPANWIGDKGYIGNGMLTPFRKPAGGELLQWQKEFNTAINRIRYVIERAIAHVKTWRILHSDYRRPLSTFAGTISAVIALEFYRLACE